MQGDDDRALAAIEQEMLAIKQLFADGHILKRCLCCRNTPPLRQGKSPKNLTYLPLTKKAYRVWTRLNVSAWRLFAVRFAPKGRMRLC